MPDKKTIFLACFHPYVSRNIYATPFLDALKTRGDLALVLLVPEYKAAYFTERFAGGNLTVLGVKTGFVSKTRLGLLFKRFAELAHVSETNTVKHRLKFRHERSYTKLTAALAVGFIGRSHLVRRLVRALDLRLSPRGVFEPLFEAYKPALVFGTDVFSENDVALLEAGRRAGVKTVGFVRSWDNPSKYLLRCFPDRLLVGSREVAREMARFHRYPAGRITAVGNPHYDRYRTGATESRERFCARFSLDPAEPFILFCPVGDDLIRRNDFDGYITQLLADTGRQILVRYPPASAVAMEGFSGAPNVKIDRPGVGFSDALFTDREITREEDERLINSLVYAAVVVTGPTSILLDACFFDRPLIAADFYPGGTRDRLDAIYEYDYYHIRVFFREAPGARLVKSPEELRKAIDEYLADPAKDAGGRAAVRAHWFSGDDGDASARLAREILAEVA